MWNKEKSVKLTHFMVRIFYFILTVTAVLSVAVPLSDDEYKAVIFYLVPFYISVPFGYAALVCLDRLLINIKKGIVFDNQNVKYLRLLSWLCFSVCIITLMFAGIVIIRLCLDSAGVITVKGMTIFEWYYSVLAFCVSVAELFVGIVVRVIKNIFDSAIKIKEENELTI